MTFQKLLTTNNRKTLKSIEYGYRTGILEFAPHNIGGRNVCPKSTEGCRSSCIFTYGFGRFSSVQDARLRRKLYYFNDRKNFLRQLEGEILIEAARARADNFKFAVRINGMSDIPSLAIEMARRVPDVQFYDYTKIHKTLRRSDLPANYHLTFSRSGDNDAECRAAIKLGYNVSVVFPVKEMKRLPERFFGLPVTEGDSSDLRFLDPPDHVIALSAKGQGQTDNLGFVYRG